MAKVGNCPVVMKMEVCPLNHHSVGEGGDSPTSAEASFRGVVSQSGATNGTSFMDDQLELFEKRLEEGYDLFVDADYVHWLEMHHPEALPPDRYTLTSVDDDVATSVVEEFTSITPETPVTITDGEVVTPKQTSSSTGSSGISIISKYLVRPTSATPSGIGQKSLPRARLLTSAESLAMLEEKEKKQQDEKEQKEKWEKEWEEKCKQREADKKRKAEEQAKKAEERVKKAK